jgi:steroid delta-isomerase-like uncharacterized protein
MPAETPLTEANKAVVRRWFLETDQGNLDAIDEMLTADYVDHNPAIPGLPPGREGIRQANLLLREAFPDAVHTIEEQLAEGDKVMTRVTSRGTFKGAFLGFPPTGEVVEISGLAVHRIVDGKLAEHWAYADMLGFMRRIGAVADPAAGAPD